MIIDSHSHCFPDDLAPRALSALEHNAEQTQMRPFTDGTAEGTKKLIAAHGIDRAVVCNIATNAHQQPKVNNFAISLARSNSSLIPLGSLHPDFDDNEAELKRLIDAGIKGIKIHPDYITTEINDAKFDNIFSICESSGVFVVTHAGWDPISPNHIHATPQGILDVITCHPNLKLVAAHMGGYSCSDEVLDKLVGRDIYIDTSLSSHRDAERDNLIKILRRHDPDRLLFATDTPWSNPQKELEFIYSAKLSDDLTEKILFRNAISLLRL